MSFVCCTTVAQQQETFLKDIRYNFLLTFHTTKNIIILCGKEL
jgi:hypothetical protein